MSDTEQTATADIASRTLDSLEAQSAPPEPTPAADTPAPASGDGPPVETPSDAEVLLREQGYTTPRKPDGREHWIPRSKVLAMIESGLKKRAANLDKERESWKGEKEMLAKAAQEAERFRHLVNTDPQALLHRLAALDARYKAFIGQGGNGHQPNAPAAAEDPEPQPDFDLGGGRMTYSTQGIQKLRAWERRQMQRELTERLQPFQDRLKAEDDREAARRVEHTLQRRTEAIVNKVKTWPRFAEHEAAIVKVLQDDSTDAEARGIPPQKSVYDAYLEVAVPALAATHATVREQVLQELNAAPKSTSTGARGPEAVKAPGPRSTEEIARRVQARLEGTK